MNPSERFFAKLRKLTVYLETESSNLLHASQSLKENDEDDKNGAQALYQLHSEVKQLKRQVQDQVVIHDAGTIELRTFIRRCLVLKQRTTEDIDRLKKHYEKYGYRSRKAGQENTVLVMDSAKEEEEGGKTDAAQKDEVMRQEAQQSETPEKMPPPSADHLRTPQLSDFGLSALHFQRVSSEAEPPHDFDPAPAMALSPPPFVINTQPLQPKTPKCSLSMEDDAPTPQLEDFGISEYTTCWNNDFTMDLFNKKPPKRNRETTENAHKRRCDSSSLSSVSYKGVVNESVKSPEPPVFCTPGFKIEKPQIPSSPQMNKQNNLDSPPRSKKGPSTPELPAFETPFVSKFLKKEARQEENESQRSSQGNCFLLPDLSNDNKSSSCSLEMPKKQSYEATMPEIPTLQSLFGSSLAFKSTTRENLSGIRMDLKEGPVPLPKDSLNQDWCLATPKVRMKFHEPCTPEMPDISSVTQDILKPVAQCKS